MARLLEEVFFPAFDNPLLARRHDGAAFALDARCAFTTDSYVVDPLFFPGGDIGTLAVYGTVNDLAMCGATPVYLSAGFIIEEGFEIATLRRIVESMRDACAAAEVSIVTGDIKVVDRGAADKLFINTSGVGRIAEGADVGPDRVRPGDRVLLSGDIGRHGMAVLNAREKLGFEPPIESDCAPVAAPVRALLDAGIDVRCLRDLTRGGLASGLVEIAEKAGVGIAIEEDRIPVRADVAAACELLGLDPLYVANEGRFVAFVDARDEARALEVLRRYPVSCETRVIGEAHAAPARQVWSVGFLGAKRVIDMLSGEQLPRIC
jgi:hydrogenase expression/formation protein HypE